LKAGSNIMQRVSDGAELMIGEASLASLYKACVKCFKGFKLKKRDERGFKLNDVKYNKPQVSSLQSRLENWGKYLNVLEPGRELPALRERWQEEKVVVGAALEGIRDILRDEDELYSTTPRMSRLRTYVRRLTCRNPMQVFEFARYPYHHPHRGHFHTFISILSDHIRDLEAVNTRLAIPIEDWADAILQEAWQQGGRYLDCHRQANEDGAVFRKTTAREVLPARSGSARPRQGPGTSGLNDANWSANNSDVSVDIDFDMGDHIDHDRGSQGS
jgi:hypothetical protein